MKQVSYELVHDYCYFCFTVLTIIYLFFFSGKYPRQQTVVTSFKDSFSPAMPLTVFLNPFLFSLLIFLPYICYLNCFFITTIERVALLLITSF